MNTAPAHRRWHRHRRPAVTLCEVAVWAAVLAITAGSLLLLCALLTLAWPSP